MLGFQALGVLALGEVQVVYTIVPNADDTDGTWTNELGGTTLYTSINETASDDADYIQSVEGPSLEVCSVALGDPGVTPAEPMSVHYRFAKDIASGTMDLRVRLMQGASPIATWTETNISTNLLYVEHTLTAAEFASISDFTALTLEFRANYTP